MKKILILLLGLYFTGSSNAANFYAECNGCNNTQSRNKAMSLANQVGNFGYVYIFDFTYHDLKKYRVWRENLNSDLVNSPSHVLVYRETPSASEVDKFNKIDDVFDTLLVPKQIEGEVYFTTEHPNTGDWVGTSFGAYDLIGNRSLGVDLIRNVDDSSFTENIMTALQALEAMTSIFEVLNLNYEVTINFTFPDGSVGIAKFDEFGDLSFVDSLFVDVDGNRIPLRPSDARGMTYDFSVGGVGGYTNMMTRLALLGLISSRTCTGSCDIDSCTTTCSYE